MEGYDKERYAIVCEICRQKKEIDRWRRYLNEITECLQDAAEKLDQVKESIKWLNQLSDVENAYRDGALENFNARAGKAS